MFIFTFYTQQIMVSNMMCQIIKNFLCLDLFSAYDCQICHIPLTETLFNLQDLCKQKNKSYTIDN